MITTEKNKTLFAFSDPVDFLVHTIDSSKSHKNRSAWTLTAWSKRLGYQSPRSLGMILKKQRALTPKMVVAIGKSLKLNANEFRYFELLVKRELLMKSSLDTSFLDREILDLQARAKTHAGAGLTLGEREFALIAKWYHLPIKQLISTPDFHPSADWIRRRLRNKLSNLQVTEALANLIAVGAIRKDEGRGYVVNEGADVRQLNNIPSLAVKQHHAQMMERAQESIGEQSVSQRELQGLVLCVNPESFSDAKEAIREFTVAFNHRFGGQISNHVYQLNVQFFEHTEDL